MNLFRPFLSLLLLCYVNGSNADALCEQLRYSNFQSAALSCGPSFCDGNGYCFNYSGLSLSSYSDGYHIYCSSSVSYTPPDPSLPSWTKSYYGVVGFFSRCEDADSPPPTRAAAAGTRGGNNLCGSVVGLESQTLGEYIPIVGSDFGLYYHSGFVKGRSGDFKMGIQLSGATPRELIQGFQIDIYRGGSIIQTQSYGNTLPNQRYDYVWDGLDINGVPSREPEEFAFGVTETSSVGSITYKNKIELGHFDSKSIGLGGWLPSNYAFYSNNVKTLYKADGSPRRVNARPLGPNNIYVAEEDGSKVYIFDLQGKLTQIKSGLLGTAMATFNYDSVGRLTSIMDPFGRHLTFNRNGSGVLTSVTAINGQVTAITMDANGYIASVTNPNNESFNLSYYGTQGLLQTFQKPGGQVSTFYYDSDGNLTKDAHSGGYFFDLVKNLNSTNDIDISSVTPMGRVSRSFGSGGSSGAKISHTKASGQQTLFEYNRSQTNTSLNVTKDGTVSQLTLEDDPRFGGTALNVTSVHQYHQNGGSAITASNSYSATLEDPNNPFSLTSWSMTSHRNGGSHSLITTFDPVTKKIMSTSALGKTEETIIDAFERVESHKIGNLTPVLYSYIHENLTSITQGPRVTSFSYNQATSRLSSVTNPLNQTTAFTRDNVGRVTAITLPDSRVIGFSYNSNGDMISIVPPGRPAHGFLFNAQEVLSSYLPPILSGIGVVNTTYEYNLDKQLTKITKPNGSTVDYYYNSTSGLLQYIVTPSESVSFSMSAMNGLPTYISSNLGSLSLGYSGKALSSSNQYFNSDGGWIDFSTQFTSLGNLKSADTLMTAMSSSQIDYSYNDDQDLILAGVLGLSYNVPMGQLTGTTMGAGSNEITDSYVYNNYGELKQYQAKYGNTVIYDLTLARDGMGRIEGKTQVMNGVTANFDYDYDSTGRLTETKKNLAVVATYAYDTNSNRSGGAIGSQPTSATYDDQDRLLTYNTLSFTYNANGELNSKTNNTLNQTVQYVYDVFGNLTQVTMPNGTVIDYEIDGLNRRVGKKVNGVLQKRWAYMDQYRIAAEIDPSGVITKRFVYASKGNIPDYMISGGENYRIVSDHLGSPRLVVRQSNGTIVHRMNHDEFGRVTEDTNPGYLPFGFAGGLYDVDTGLVRFGARDFDPETGRWTSKDPILFKGGDTNLYGYVLNDPVNWNDPSGLDRRRCSRNLGGSPVKAGTLRHDYAQFRDSKGNITTKSWGNNGMISESGNAKGLQCEGWSKSSDKADNAAMDMADNLNDLMDYDLLNYNCQDYTTDVLNFQQGR